MPLKVAVVDGMGGGIGALVVQRLKQALGDEHTVIALGTNAIATAGMLKAGASIGATGENAIIRTAQTADVIVGPVGIVIPNSLLGEITPAIATAIASCPAVKVLIPLSQPHVELIGLESRPLSAVLDEVSSRVHAMVK